MNTFSIINVGSELMRGQTLNTHHQQIASKLGMIGWSNRYAHATLDSLSVFSTVFIHALQQSDTIVITGGLGPTHDDLTLEYISQTLGLPLEINKRAKQMLEDVFKKIKKPLSSYQLKQALLPKGALPLRNQIGIAPGVMLQWRVPAEMNFKTIFVLPGPPKEMNQILEDEVIPRLMKLNTAQSISHSCSFAIPLAYESHVFDKISKELKRTDGSVIGIYPQIGMVQLHISKAYNKQSRSQDDFKSKISRIYNLLKPLPVFPNLKDNFNAYTQKVLKKKNYTVSAAESCTGGMLSACLTNDSGASKLLLGSCVTYSNKEKERQLNIASSAINRHGAVSHQIAAMMSRSIRLLTSSTFGIGISGIAGPSGETPSKPVGTVYIAIATKKKTRSHHFRFSGSRSAVRTKAVIASHLLLLEEVLQKKFDIPSRVDTELFYGSIS